MDHLEPVRPHVNERLPTHRIERDALDVAAAPLVDDWHTASFDLVRIETRLIVLRAMGQREGQDASVISPVAILPTMMAAILFREVMNLSSPLAEIADSMFR